VDREAGIAAFADAAGSLAEFLGAERVSLGRIANAGLARAVRGAFDGVRVPSSPSSDRSLAEV
jgi:hypothetical protein